MPRSISVWLPTFPTDLVKRRLRKTVSYAERGRDYPITVLLVRALAGRERIEHCCERATRASVVPGMEVAHARSLLPSRATVHVERCSLVRNQAALRDLARWASRYSPIVATSDDGLLIDVSGMDKVHPCEHGLLRRMHYEFHRLGLAARIAIASTFACAWAVARYAASHSSVVESGEEKEAIAALPISALSVESQVTDALAAVGVERIGELWGLPRNEIISRYGGALIERLDQALNRSIVPETIHPVQPKAVIRSAKMFDGPTDHVESVQAATRRVLQDVMKLLVNAQRGVRRLCVTFTRPFGETQDIEVVLTKPSSDFRHLWKLIETKLERTDMSRGIEGVTITATRTARMRNEQLTGSMLGVSNAAVQDVAVGELIDTLVCRLGHNGVLHAQLVASHVPEQSFRFVPVVEECEPCDDIQEQAPDRPTILYRAPESARAIALTPDGPLLRLDWRNQHHLIAHCIGPERVSPEWWRWNGISNAPPERDYFAVQTSQGRWLFAAHQPQTGRWFIHGEWA